VVSSRKQEACEEAAAEVRSLGRRAFAHCCHIGHWDEIDGLVDAAYDNFGKVDILVNNAGLAPTYPNPQSVTEDLWDKTIAVNLKGPYRLTALVGQRMVAGNGGSIVNISSIGGVRPTNDILPYAAAKAGLNALTIGFADALGPTVRVNAVMPGPFLTDISRNWDHEAFAERARTFALRRAGDPDELASAVLYFASDASSFTTGAALAVDGGAQWSLAGGGEQAEYGHSLYDGKRDWT
jgi:NAD(P)-dependent dehydrogenase (short-subunit alcohol dehydrogenase family)